MIRYIIFCATFLFYLTGIMSQETSSTETTTIVDYDQDIIEAYNSSYSHCFRFTWLGPGYDENSKINGTCNDLSQKYKLKNTPCKQPLVITTNGALPNMTDIFIEYRDIVTCRRSTGQICIKYSYIFNGQYENITYMCGKVITDEEGAETSGCYTEYNNGYQKEVCMCRPKTKNDENGIRPCNSAQVHKMSALGLLALFTCFLLQARLTT